MSIELVPFPIFESINPGYQRSNSKQSLEYDVGIDIGKFLVIFIYRSRVWNYQLAVFEVFVERSCVLASL